MEKKRGGGPKRTRQDVGKDQIFIIPLFLKNVGFADIAEQLSKEREYEVTYKTVHNDVQKILKDWRKERFEQIDDQRKIDLKKIDQLEATYWEAWERSKKTKLKTVDKQRALFNKKTKKQVDDFVYREGQKHETESIGDIQWLQGVERCIAARAELLGYKKAFIPPSADDVIPAARDVVFITRSRKNNEQFTDAVEVPPEDSGAGISTLIKI